MTVKHWQDYCKEIARMSLVKNQQNNLQLAKMHLVSSVPTQRCTEYSVSYIRASMELTGNTSCSDLLYQAR